MTRRFAVIGDPIEHSLSPAMQQAAFNHLGIDATYARRHVTADALPTLLACFDEEGIEGFNVTLPHKVAIQPFLDQVDETATRVGAVNTVYQQEGRWLGTNTDAEGFWRSIEGVVTRFHQRSDARTAIVLGAGGAARAVVVALRDHGYRVGVMARRPTQAQMLEALGTSTLPWGAPLEATLVVNATSASLYDAGDASGFAASLAMEAGAAKVYVDLVYAPQPLPFLARARALGAQTVDGIGMLVHQGALAFAHWTGQRGPAQVMERALREALALREQTRA